jgi:hypothetical protein
MDYERMEQAGNWFVNEMLPMLVQFKIGYNKLTMACRSDMGKVIIIGGDRGWSQAKSAPD